MTTNEAHAVLNYIDDRLSVLCKTMESHLDNDSKCILYEQMYHLIQDLSHTLAADIEIKQVTQSVKIR